MHISDECSIVVLLPSQPVAIVQDLSGVAVLHFDDVRTAFGGHAEAVNATR